MRKGKIGEKEKKKRGEGRENSLKDRDKKLSENNFREI